MLHSTLNKLHHALSRSRPVVRFLLRLRNQINCVIAFHLGETNDSDKNGESDVVKIIAPVTKRFVDVGANVGEWSESFIKLADAEGILFEPLDRLHEKLSARFKDNPKIEIRKSAVGDTNGTITFVEDLGYDQVSSVSETFVPTTGQVRTMTVPITTLDEALFGTGSVYDFVKVDTEGYDYRVILGADELLKAGRIRFLQFEYNEQWLGAGASLKTAQRRLNDHGYEVRLIRSTGLHEIDYDTWGDYFRYSNYLAFRHEERPVLSALLRGKL